MNSKRTLLTLSLFLLMGTYLLSPFFFHVRTLYTAALQRTSAPSLTFPQEVEVAAWMWQSPSFYRKEYLQYLFRNAKNEGITSVYIRIDEYIDIVELPKSKLRTERLKSLDNSLRSFVRTAHQYDIEVYALAGHEKWADELYRYIPTTLTKYVISYNSTSAPEERLKGVQFDIEPHNKKEFSDPEKQEQILTDLFLTIEDVVEVTGKGQPDLTVGFAVPFWLDNATRTLPRLTFAGKTKSPIFHVIDLLNRAESGQLVVMAYRKNPTGSNGTINLVKEEINYAKNTNVKVVVAQEVLYSSTANITFFGSNKASVKNAAAAIQGAYAGSVSFGGIAIHDLEGYLSLLN